MIENHTDGNYIKRWQEIQNKINVYLEKILLRIEWNYGDCRSPFLFPPNYNLIHHEDMTIEYVCILILEMVETESLRYSATDPEELYRNIKEDIDEKYGIK